MIIKDSFLTTKELDELKSTINFELKTYDSKFNECEFKNETDHFGTNNSNLYYLENEAKTLFLKFLVNNNFFDKKCLTGTNLTLRYHALTSPYISTWHKDRTLDWEADKIDYIGVSYFFSKGWDFTKGGIYLYKKDKESSQGYYIEPRENRLIINANDFYHAVTQINDQSFIRQSLQLFIHKEYFLL
jgi:hypothetical protein